MLFVDNEAKQFSMGSLLGLFYNRIRGSQEDIASEGLVYILKNSHAARNAFNSLISLYSGIVFTDINYISQSIGENLERPDISGLNDSGKEVVIIEAKFWASLTSNQPVEYLNRLEGNSLVLFVCPKLRIRSVYSELRLKLTNADISFSSDTFTHKFDIAPNKKLLVKTWEDILGALRTALVQDNDHVHLSDIDQIIGFCSTIDKNSFLPLQADDLSPGIARTINSFNDIVDGVIDELKKRKSASTTRLKATPQRFGYTRYFWSGEMGVSLNVRFDYWQNSAATPFWLCIKDKVPTDKSWNQSELLKGKIKELSIINSIILNERDNGDIFIALFPLLDSTEDLVVDNLANQIIELIKILS